MSTAGQLTGGGVHGTTRVQCVAVITPDQPILQGSLALGCCWGVLLAVVVVLMSEAGGAHDSTGSAASWLVVCVAPIELLDAAHARRPLLNVAVSSSQRHLCWLAVPQRHQAGC